MTFDIEGQDTVTGAKTRGKLTLVDLAGSESAKKSGSTGGQQKEGTAINKVFLNVGKVLLALSEKKTHIPYRNSPLTRLLSDSLGGNAKTLMFVNVSPTNSNLSETTKSLMYGARARDIQNAASKNN